MTQQPTHDFVTERATDTRGRLAQIPILLAEVALTVGAPNPGTSSERTRRPHPGSRVPVDLDLLELLTSADADPDSLAPLPMLIDCSRLIWGALNADDEAALGRPDPEPTYATECAWLHRAWPTAVAVLDKNTLDWIENEIRLIHDRLCQRVRLRREKTYRCPECGDPMRLQDGGEWLLCDSGHTQEADLETRYRRMPPMPVPMVADLLGIPESTLYVWKHRKKITPVRVERGVPWVLPWDALLLRNPDVAEAITRREANEGE